MRLGILCGFVFAGTGYILLGLAPSLPLACAAVVFAHAGGSMLWVFSATLLQLRTEDRFRRPRVFRRVRFQCDHDVALELLGRAVGRSSRSSAERGDFGWSRNAVPGVAVGVDPARLAGLQWGRSRLTSLRRKILIGSCYARPGRRHGLRGPELWCAQRFSRRGCFQHRHHRLSGNLHRSFLCRADRRSDQSANRQLRRESVRSGSGQAVHRRLDGARVLGHRQQLALRRSRPSSFSPTAAFR